LSSYGQYNHFTAEKVGGACYHLGAIGSVGRALALWHYGSRYLISGSCSENTNQSAVITQVFCDKIKVKEGHAQR